MRILAVHDLDPNEDLAARHSVPPLPYPVDVLEPVIDARTMTLHHDAHHAGYVEELNAALSDSPTLQQKSPVWLLCNLSQVPRERRAAVHHSAGGHVNHSLFWQSMTPIFNQRPLGALHEAMCQSFGSIAAFKSGFEEAGRKLFGSGWVWLVAPHGSAEPLEIVTTEGHDHPAMQGLVPLLLNDVWEHAYYLRYGNFRADYLSAWWTVVDWSEVSRRFEARDEELSA